MSVILQERRDSIAIIRLNCPAKHNALSREMIVGLSDAFEQLEKQTDVRAVILTGSGERAFCAGTDISELATLTEEVAFETSKRGQDVCERIERGHVPVIAAINGVAAGGGVELALASHIRLASNNAQFSLPEAKLGVIPGYGGTQRLAREIGKARALEMMLTNKTVSADEARQIGLVNRVVEPAALISKAESLATEIAQMAPLAIRACLEAVTRGLDLPLEEGLALEAKLFASLFASQDMREGTRAFLEKRVPVFKGM
jgi:enoyl-CoA hydratase